MRIFFFVAIVLVLFGGPAVLFQFGWMIEFGGAPAYQKLHPSFYLLFLLFLFLLVSRYRKIGFVKKEIIALFFISLTALTMVFDTYGLGVSLLINNIVVPVLISGCLLLIISNDSSNNRKVFRLLRNLVLFFFIANSLVAIMERILLVNLVTYMDGAGQLLYPWLWGVEDFRSTGLHNHPLSNALLISTIMLFVLQSNLRTFVKIGLYFTGFLALLSFNTRFAILIMAIYFLLFIARGVFMKTKIKVSYFFLIVGSLVMSSFILILILQYDFGGRLFSLGVYDDYSAGARLKIMNVLEAINFRILFFGGGSYELNLAAKSLGLYHIENFWIIYLFRIGAVFLILIFLSVGAVLSSYIQIGRYPGYKIILFFLILVSSNNSLAVGVPALAIFILSSYTFLPQRNFERRYLKPVDNVEV